MTDVAVTSDIATAIAALEAAISAAVAPLATGGEITTAVSDIEAAISAAQTAILAGLPSVAGLATETAVEAAIAAAEAAILTAVSAIPTTTIPTGLATGADVSASTATITAAISAAVTTLAADISAAVASLARTSDVTSSTSTINGTIASALTTISGWFASLASTVSGYVSAGTSTVTTAISTTQGVITGAISSSQTAIIAAIPSIASLATSTALAAVQATVNAIQSAALSIANVTTGCTTALTSFGAATAANVTAAQGVITAAISATQTAISGYITTSQGVITAAITTSQGVITAAITAAQGVITSAITSATSPLATTAQLNSQTTTLAADITAAQVAVIASLPSQTYPSGILQTFAGASPPAGWTTVSWNPYSVTNSKGFTFSQPFRAGTGGGSVTQYPLASAGGLLWAFISSSGPGSSFQSYNPTTDTWTTTGYATNANVLFYNPGFIGLPSGLLLTTGGKTASTGSGNCYTFNPATNTYTAVATQPSQKMGSCLVLDAAGANVYAFFSVNQGPDNPIHIYNISGNSWTTSTATFGAAGTTVGTGGTAALLPSGNFLLVDYSLGQYCVFNPASGGSTTTPAALPTLGNTPRPVAVSNSTGALLYADVVYQFIEGTGFSTSSAWGPPVAYSTAFVPGKGQFFVYGPVVSVVPLNTFTVAVTASKN